MVRSTISEKRSVSIGDCAKAFRLPSVLLGVLILSGCAEKESSSAVVVSDEQTELSVSLEEQLDVDVPHADKQAVISYTKQTQRLEIGKSGLANSSKFVAIDPTSLSDAEAAAYAIALDVLKRHLELSEVDDAQLLEIVSTRWPNSGLGCARPGEMSSQAIVDGYKVVLVLAGLRHQIHTGIRGGRVCERLQGMLQAPRRALTMSALPRLQQEAIADLAGQLGISGADIVTGRVTPAHWPNSSLGCPEPGVEYVDEHISGYFIPLTALGRTVQYRTDGVRVIACEGLEALKLKDR